MTRFGKYIVNILIGIDQLGNALSGGDPDETISSRLGRMKRDNGGTIPWRFPIARIIDKVLDDIDPGHSTDAIEGDEGGNAILQ